MTIKLKKEEALQNDKQYTISSVSSNKKQLVVMRLPQESQEKA